MTWNVPPAKRRATGIQDLARYQAMSVGVNLTSDEMTQLRHVTKASDDVEAVSVAAREYLRIAGLRELKSVSGKVELMDNWSDLESLEAGETSFPQ